jgi:hypothetical protein
MILRDRLELLDVLFEAALESEPSPRQPRTITGKDAVQVYVRERDRIGREIVRSKAVFHGEELPEGLIEGELERIEALGAFDDETPREKRLRERKELKRLEAEARAKLHGEPPPGDGPAMQRGQVVDVTEDRKRV